MTHCCKHNCIEELKSDHQNILETLDKLEKSLNSSVIDKEGIKDFLRFTETFAEPHHQKEEKVLFPALENKGVPKEGGPIGMMLLEHDTKRNYVKKLSNALADDRTGDIKENAQAIISLLRSHIEKEDNILYPMAQQVLTEDELVGLGGQCEKIKKEYEFKD